MKNNYKSKECMLSADSMKTLGLNSAISNTPYYWTYTNTIYNPITLSLMGTEVADSDNTTLKINIKKNQIKFNFNL